MDLPLRNAVGRDLHTFICGGAPLSAGVEDFFSALGFHVVQGYGLTEASPVVSCNVPLAGHVRAHTVGRCLPGQRLRFAGAAFTNVSGDHLDYHGTMEAYAAAKRTLFEELPEDGWAVINADDAVAEEIVARCPARVLTTSLRR